MSRASLIVLFVVLLPPLYCHAAPNTNAYYQRLSAGRPKPAPAPLPAKPERPKVVYEKIITPVQPQESVRPRPTVPRPTRPHGASAKKNLDDVDPTITRFNPCLNKISSFVSDIDSKVGVVESIVDNLDACETTPIFGPGPVTISAPGSYCLAQNVDTITISASQVNLNLNGYVVSSTTTGITLAGISPADITIRNGIVQATNNATGTGISMPGGSGITIIGVTIENWDTGVVADDLSDLLMSNCLIFDNNTTGFN